MDHFDEGRHLHDCIPDLRTGALVWWWPMEYSTFTTDPPGGMAFLQGTLLRVDVGGGSADSPCGLFVIRGVYADNFWNITSDGTLAVDLDDLRVDRPDEEIPLSAAIEDLNLERLDIPERFANIRDRLITRGLPRDADDASGLRYGEGLFRFTMRQTCRECYHTDHLPPHCTFSPCSCPDPAL
jgi:hypothetical protein